jgi:hypothetical protein
MSKVKIVSGGFITGIFISIAVLGKIEDTYEKRLTEIRRIKGYYNKSTDFALIKKSNEDKLFTFLFYIYYDWAMSSILTAYTKNPNK